MKEVLAVSHAIKCSGFDDDYTLYESGEILHKYDEHIYPGGLNLSKSLTADQVGTDVKERLLSAAPKDKKNLVRELLKMK